MNKPIIEANKVVSFTYSIIDEQGEIFEQSDLPVDYIHGIPNNMFEKVEHALSGKKIGDTVQVQLAPQEAFGAKDPNLIISDHVDNSPPEYRHVGAKPVFQNEQGEMLEMTVTHVDHEKIIVDGNHPLAGQTITFHLNVIEIRNATIQELKTGAVEETDPTIM